MQIFGRPHSDDAVLGARPRHGAALAVLLLLALVPAAAAEDDWKFDVVHLKNGGTLRGILDEQTSTEIRFRCVSRKPGAHTVVIPTTTLRPDEVDSLELLDARERETLAARLKALDPTGKGEAQRMASLELKPVAWGKDGRVKALRYESTHFVLESNASEDVVRRAAVRLEQIFAAYTRFLPPRHESGQPTTILLAQSQADYQALLKDRGRLLLNPAFYDVEHNEIVCGTDLQRLGDLLEQTRQRHQRLLGELKDKEAELKKLFKGEVPPALTKDINTARSEIDEQIKRNDKLFQDATGQLFRVLYHEAFHAYLMNFVYPPEEADVPRWLNEGLAQIFETAFVEASELRIGQADAVRLKQAQAVLGRGELVPIADLIKSGPKQFVVLHASDQQTSDRYYLTSWAAAFYLTFERRLLGTKSMDQYVLGLKRGTDPARAFAELVGQTPKEFEKEFQQYVKDLRPDGTVAHRPGGK
jgi:hypothetical protein